MASTVEPIPPSAASSSASSPFSQAARSSWEQVYNQRPLHEVPYQFASLNGSPFLMEYFAAVLKLCPPGGHTLETGIGGGLGTIWLSLRGVQAEGFDNVPVLVERARQSNSVLGGSARFWTGDLFALYEAIAKQAIAQQQQNDTQDWPYDVIHHQGVLEHFALPWMRAILAQQVALARRVVFSVPSVYYSSPEMGDERLLPLEEWQRVVEPFEVEELRYYGHPQSGNRDHILCVLRGQAVTPELLALMQVAIEPYPSGISAIVHTRNEERHIAECLATLQEWTDEIIVCDMESSDQTVAIAESLGAQIVRHPLLANFDQARNVSALRARYRWVFYLDADERVPAALGQALRSLVVEPSVVEPSEDQQSDDQLTAFQPPDFAALLPPFRHHFAGHWLRCLYPGYTSPRLFKNGRFFFNARLHAGAQVEGPLTCFPGDDPNLALVHYSFDSLSHYLDKLNRYTEGEADNMHRDGQLFHWQNAMRHFVADFRAYYDQGKAHQDGVHGFLYSFLSAFYRFEQHAKLFERRYRNRQLQAPEGEVPGSVEEVLEFALHALREQRMRESVPPSLPPAAPIRLASPLTVSQHLSMVPSPDQNPAESGDPAPSAAQPVALHGDLYGDLYGDLETNPSTPASALSAPTNDLSAPAGLVWSGPLFDPSGYGEETRQFVAACHTAHLPIAAQALPWSRERVELPEEEETLFEALMQREALPGFVHVIQNFPPAFGRHPQAGFSVGRTMFETDRLPQVWVEGCNRLDAVWVPSAWNLSTFARAGVAREKLAVIPGCLDESVYQASPVALWEALSEPEKILLGEAGFQPLERPTNSDKRAMPFTFLTVFDWTLHKGWDVLLRAFLEEFKRDDAVRLVLKVWSTMGYDDQSLRAQAVDHIRETLGHDLSSDERIVFLQERLSSRGMRALYAGCDAFVLPSRGEGWGRPLMEAMAWGKPTIGTNWSGNTAFMNRDNSYLLDCRLQAVPGKGYREIPTYQGHRWAEPDREHLRHTLRRVYEEREEAERIGQRARHDVLNRFNQQNVGCLIAREIQRLSERLQMSERLQKRLQTGRSSDHRCHKDAKDDLAGAEKPEQEANRSDKRALDSVPSAVSPHPLIAVRWEGDFFLWHSLAHVNRELCADLLESGVLESGLSESGGAHSNGGTEGKETAAPIELSLVTDASRGFPLTQDARWPPLASSVFAPLSAPAQVHVRHAFPPHFQTPPEGHLVIMQPWEYGYLPVQWLEPLHHQVSEVWCYSRYVHEVYRQSGIPEDKLQIIPLGVNTAVFNPQAPPYIFTEEPGASRVWNAMQLRDALTLPRCNGEQRTGEQLSGTPITSEPATGTPPSDTLTNETAQRPFTFLFVGGTIHRKGFDILLEAYLKAFSAYDEVCLVVKDSGTDTVYRGHHSRERLLELAGDETRPPIVYLEPDLAPHQLSGVYTACDCLVMPYRGEGFLLPALEALACGLPVIVPEGGPTDDFVDESVGWRIKAEKKPYAASRVGEWDFCGPAWQFEVAVDDLARLLRKVAAQPQEARRRGEKGAQRVARQWKWQQAADKVRERLCVLARQPLPIKNQVIASPTLKTSQTKAGNAKAGNANVGAVKAGQKTEPSRAEVNRATKNGVSASTPRPTPTISLCMIVRDEERVLGDCLRSIKPYVDEIIVVDTGSSDATVALAQEEGARVFHFPWCDDFSAARNESLQYATGDWILWMDADDTIPPQCGAKLHDLVTLAEARTTGFLMQVQIPPAPGEVGLTVVDHVKLFRNHLGLRFSGRIHEQILEAIHQTGGRVERSELYVVHSGYDYSAQGQQKKRERDLTLLEKDLAERPGHPFVLFNIGMTAHHMKEHDKAIEALEACLKVSHPRESIVRKAYAMLAGSYKGQGNPAQARTAVEQGLQLYPRDPELLFRAGIIYHAIGELALAESSYRRLLTERESGHIDSLDVSMTGFKAQHNLALVYLDLGRFAEAEAQFLAALQGNAQFAPSWQGLAELYQRQGRGPDLAAVQQRLAPLLLQPGLQQTAGSAA